MGIENCDERGMPLRDEAIQKIAAAAELSAAYAEYVAAEQKVYEAAREVMKANDLLEVRQRILNSERKRFVDVYNEAFGTNLE